MLAIHLYTSRGEEHFSQAS